MADLMERLSALEHDQWAHWTRYMLDNLTQENIERWKRQCDTPYEELSEKEKESDREWARKVLNEVGKEIYVATGAFLQALCHVWVIGTETSVCRMAGLREAFEKGARD